MAHPKNSKERRTLNDRRFFSYTAYVPERRSGTDRREAAIIKMKTKVA
jgi:hypothetical protein